MSALLPEQIEAHRELQRAARDLADLAGILDVYEEGERAVVQRFIDLFLADDDASFGADRLVGDAETARGQRFRLEMAAFGRGWSSTREGT